MRLIDGDALYDWYNGIDGRDEEYVGNIRQRIMLMPTIEPSEETARLRAELEAAQRRAEAAVGWADCVVDVMTSGRRGIVEERLSALSGYRKWREEDRRGPDAGVPNGQDG